VETSIDASQVLYQTIYFSILFQLTYNLENFGMVINVTIRNLAQGPGFTNSLKTKTKGKGFTQSHIHWILKQYLRDNSI
jgi:hypothetical protein